MEWPRAGETLGGRMPPPHFAHLGSSKPTSPTRGASGHGQIAGIIGRAAQPAQGKPDTTYKVYWLNDDGGGGKATER
jgi:hypothetical protein